MNNVSKGARLSMSMLVWHGPLFMPVLCLVMSFLSSFIMLALVLADVYIDAWVFRVFSYALFAILGLAHWGSVAYAIKRAVRDGRQELALWIVLFITCAPVGLPLYYWIVVHPRQTGSAKQGRGIPFAPPASAR